MIDWGTVPKMEVRLRAQLLLTCDVCAKPLLIMIGGVGGQWVFHDGCDTPKVGLEVCRTIMTTGTSVAEDKA
jgi:hypothetical protein